MSDMVTDVSQCNGCGAPLALRPTFNHPIKCEYCDLTNYLKRTALTPTEAKTIEVEEEAEDYYHIYQESQKVLENFLGELVGDEVGKVRIKMQVSEYAFPLLLVLDDLPDRPYIDGPAKLREILDCEINDLDTMKNWTPGTSSVLDVLEEIHQKAEVALPQVMGEHVAAETTTVPAERNPLIQQILTNYDATAGKKEVTVRFYAQDGEVINLIVKRKKNFPIGLDSEVLTKYPLIRGPLEDYVKGRIDLLSTLSEIERMFYT
ncbi:MAG: hypothetical protein JSV04_13095 [Candidatus Heimdallarchaeota archaeon]|nr:MAG: hypothetical protein JSV04_13095 [Candidatus Heimdallarchaeota archaeon]